MTAGREETAGVLPEARSGGGWLFSAPADLSILGLPFVTVALAIAGSAWFGKGLHSEDAYAVWIAQFILGNSTHVILTFLLLAARRDVLHATEGQARTVIVGSSVTFAVTLACFWGTHVLFPFWSDFAIAVTLVFATHHTLSQVKGMWSLYNLRGKSTGAKAPTDAERSAQRVFVPLALGLIMIRFLFVPKTSSSEFAFLQAIPLAPAALPFEVMFALLAVWLIFAGALFRAVFASGGAASRPKLIYLSGHVAGVALMLVVPAWGAIFTAGVHGLEYYFLTTRMLRPTPSESHARLGRLLVWPTSVAVMLPLLAVGIVNAPFARVFGFAAHPSLFSLAGFALNAVVMAHYFADAFLYRFRIPEVRRVALMRLGFPA